MFKRSVFIGVVVLVSAVTLQAQIVTVSFDHCGTKNNTTTKLLHLADGDKFKVLITNSDTGNFEYSVTGITIEDSQKASADLKQWEITQEHDAAYGGYIVRATKKPTGQSSCPVSGPAREDRTWIIRTEETGWHTDVNVGLLGSALVEPEYFLDTDDGGNTVIARDEGKEDDLTLGFTSFATVFHDRHPMWGGSLGIGIADNNLSVALGPTLRLGQRAAITAGYNWGQVKTLTNGLNIGDPFTGENLTTDTSLQGDWFVAITIKGFTDVFAKKLAKDTTTKNGS